jgi:hypothetical protein
MTYFWLALMFLGITGFTYGMLIRPRPGDPESE